MDYQSLILALDNFLIAELDKHAPQTPDLESKYGYGAYLNDYDQKLLYIGELVTSKTNQLWRLRNLDIEQERLQKAFNRVIEARMAEWEEKHKPKK